MMMASIFPSRREVSPAEQRHRSPRLVLPKFRLETAALHPESFSLFFPGQNTPYSKRWAPGACQGAHKVGGRAQGGRARPPPLWLAGGPPLVLSSSNIFIYSKNILREVSGLLELCRIGLIFAPFPVQNSSCRHSPSSCKPYKIREKRHKYCDIMYN